VRVCRTCGIEKSLEEYHLQRGPRTSEGYRRPTCKSCDAKQSMAWAKANPEKVRVFRRKAKLKEKYGISIEDYNSLLEKQGGVCALCNKQHLRRPLNVDHCHNTGKVRGLLCDKCNLGIGLFDDNPELFEKVREYLT
jgi:hypothetical protein